VAIHSKKYARGPVKNFLLLFLTCIFLIGTLEITLRFLPVATGIRTIVPVNDHNPIFHVEPNRDAFYSSGWNFLMAHKKHINNIGFMNKFDYNTTDPRTLVAVVGDSYVEAFQVNDDEPFYQDLTRDNPNLRVYSFGFSGAGLSQYLIWAQYAHEKYHNNFLIVSVVSNDFDQSLKKYKFYPGFYHYDEQENGSLVLVRRDFEPNPYIKFFLDHSYLAKYLVYNLRAHKIFELIQQRFTPKNQYVNNVPLQVDTAHEQDSYRVVDAFLRDLPQYSGLSPQNILIMTDGLRASIYNPDEQSIAQNSFAAKMYNYLLAQAHLLGYNTLDLHQPFSEHYKHYQERFEFPTDGHWNALGHQVVAETIEKTSWWQQTVNSQNR